MPDFLNYMKLEASFGVIRCSPPSVRGVVQLVQKSTILLVSSPVVRLVSWPGPCQEKPQYPWTAHQSSPAELPGALTPRVPENLCSVQSRAVHLEATVIDPSGQNLRNHLVRTGRMAPTLVSFGNILFQELLSARGSFKPSRGLRSKHPHKPCPEALKLREALKAHDNSKKTVKLTPVA